MNAINKNTLNLAKWLEDELKCKVYYPGLVSNPGYEVSKRQMSGFSGILSFELPKTDPYEFQKKLKLIKATPSLGDVDTTICSPAITSHKYVSIETRIENGITDNPLRVSIGIEDTEDLKEDILQALR
ncbi:MAG: PLP-dependent transferase [Clostridiales bacterium]